MRAHLTTPPTPHPHAGHIWLATHNASHWHSPMLCAHACTLTHASHPPSTRRPHLACHAQCLPLAFAYAACTCVHTYPCLPPPIHTQVTSGLPRTMPPTGTPAAPPPLPRAPSTFLSLGAADSYASGSLTGWSLKQKEEDKEDFARQVRLTA
eukprot:1139796-Pelagomonas_calceolata.AAC.1